MLGVDDFNPMKVLFYKDKLDKLVKFHNGETNTIPYPIMLEIDLASICNYRCIFCQCANVFENKADKHSKELIEPGDWYHNILPFIIMHNIEGIFFCGGGEPLMNPNIVEYLNSLEGLNVRVCMTSNGSIIKEGLPEACAKVCEWVTFSVNAGSEKTYQSTNNPKNTKWDKFIEGLKFFVGTAKDVNKNMEISYKYVFTPDNYCELEKGYTNALELGFDQFIVKPADLTFYRGEKNHWESKDEQAIVEIIKGIETDARAKDIKIKSLMNYREEDSDSRKIRGYEKCWTQSLAPVLHPNGKMSICCDLRDVYNIGSWDQSLEDFWGSYSHIKAVRKFNKKGLANCPMRCRMGRYNLVVQDVLVDKKVNTCFL